LIAGTKPLDSGCGWLMCDDRGEADGPDAEEDIPLVEGLIIPLGAWRAASNAGLLEGTPFKPPIVGEDEGPAGPG
jgi:hypothetical protein